MRSTTTRIALAMLLPILSNISQFYKNTTTNTSIVQSTYSELSEAYQKEQDIILVDLAGNQYKNPSLATLQELSPNLISENRVRVTLENYSQDDKCSTELVLFNDKGLLVRNYSLNSCSAYGWVIFTTSDCFDIDLYHDAGQEAPFGGSIEGRVDWTFTYNQKEKISGTYFDGGAAKMFTVASPCYKNNVLTLLDRKERPSRRIPTKVADLE